MSKKQIPVYSQSSFPAKPTPMNSDTSEELTPIDNWFNEYSMTANKGTQGEAVFALVKILKRLNLESRIGLIEDLLKGKRTEVTESDGSFEYVDADSLEDRLNTLKQDLEAIK